MSIRRVSQLIPSCPSSTLWRRRIWTRSWTSHRRSTLSRLDSSRRSSVPWLCSLRKLMWLNAVSWATFSSMRHLSCCQPMILTKTISESYLHWQMKINRVTLPGKISSQLASMLSRRSSQEIKSLQSRLRTSKKSIKRRLNSSLKRKFRPSIWSCNADFNSTILTQRPRSTQVKLASTILKRCFTVRATWTSRRSTCYFVTMSWNLATMRLSTLTLQTTCMMLGLTWRAAESWTLISRSSERTSSRTTREMMIMKMKAGCTYM